jgi:hypothetical protein
MAPFLHGWARHVAEVLGKQRGSSGAESDTPLWSSNQVFDFQVAATYIGSRSLNGQSQVGGVTASTEMLAAKRHAGVHTPVIACKTIIANQTLAYAA